MLLSYPLIFLLVLPQVDSVVNTYERWNRLPTGNAERLDLGKELEAGCDSVLWQLEELENAIGMAEQDMNRFNLDQQELASRRRWVKDTRKEVRRHVSSLHVITADLIPLSFFSPQHVLQKSFPRCLLCPYSLIRFCTPSPSLIRWKVFDESLTMRARPRKRL